MHTSSATVRETLSTPHLSTIVLPADNGHVLHIRKGSSPDPELRRIYDLLGVPHRIRPCASRWCE